MLSISPINELDRQVRREIGCKIVTKWADNQFHGVIARFILIAPLLTWIGARSQ